MSLESLAHSLAYIMSVMKNPHLHLYLTVALSLRRMFAWLEDTCCVLTETKIYYEK